MHGRELRYTKRDELRKKLEKANNSIREISHKYARREEELAALELKNIAKLNFGADQMRIILTNAASTFETWKKINIQDRLDNLTPKWFFEVHSFIFNTYFTLPKLSNDENNN